LDPSPLCQCRFSRFVRRWHRCPRFSDDPCGYLSCLGRRLRAHHYDVIFPPHDEVYLLARVRDVLSQRAHIAIPEFSAVAQLQSKARFISLLEELRLPYPTTEIVCQRAELESWNGFPIYLKLDTGTAGSGVRLVRDRAELRTAIESFENEHKWQEGELV